MPRRKTTSNPLVMTNSLPWYRWPIEIEGLPINSMVIFHGELLVITRWYNNYLTTFLGTVFGARSYHASEKFDMKSAKHTRSGPLLEVEMSKKCTPLWREAHFEVKMLKTPHVRATFGGSDVVLRGRRFSRNPPVHLSCSVSLP